MLGNRVLRAREKKREESMDELLSALDRGTLRFQTSTL